MFIFEMQFIWVYLDELLGKGLSPWVITKLLVFASARLVNMALPLAILMSSIMTMGALAENNEMTAMKSAGISLMRIMRPLILFSVGLSLTAFLFANNIWPVANLKFRTMLFSIMKQKPSLNLTDGVFYNGIDGISIRAARNNQETGELTDVLIYDHRGGEKANRTVIRAESGIMEQTPDKRYLIMTLNNGHSYDEQKDKKIKDPRYAEIRSEFSQTIIRLDLSSLVFQADNEEVMKNPAEMMTIDQLNQAIDSLKGQMDTVRVQFSSNNMRLFNSRMESQKQTNLVSVADSMLFSQLNGPERAKAINYAKENSRKSRDNVQRQIDELKSRNKLVNKYKIEWHRKFFLAVVCLVLFFIGAPLGAIIRKGGIGLPTLVALGLFVVYQLLTIVGERLAKNQFVDPWIGMWISTLVLLPFSLWITFRATKEAALLDRDAYVRNINKVLERIKLKAKQDPV